MYCKSIEENSLMFIEGTMNTAAKKKFEKHINKCKTCATKYSLILNNYAKEVELPDLSISISEEVMVRIDKSKYIKNKYVRAGMRVAFLAAVVIVFAGVAVNADSLFKSYNQLVSSLFYKAPDYTPFIDTKSDSKDNTKLVDGHFVYDDKDIHNSEGFVKNIYNKYTGKVKEKLATMKTGDIDVLKFDEEKGTFIVNISKAEGKNIITFGFEGFRVFSPAVNPDKLAALKKNFFTSIDDAVASGKVAPCPSYIPDGYTFKKGQSLSTGGLGNMSLIYENETGENFSIILSPGKAGHEPEDTGEMITAGKWQGFYDKKANSLTMLVGTNVKYPVFYILSDNLSKEEMLKIAEGITLKNEEANIISTKGYFAGVKDDKFLPYAEEFLNNLEKGKNAFDIKVDDYRRIHRDGYTDGFHVSYHNFDSKYKLLDLTYDDVKKYAAFPLKLKKALPAEYVFSRLDIRCMPSQEIAENERTDFRKSDISGQLSIMIDEVALPTDTETNALMNKYSTAAGKEGLSTLRSKSGRLFYVIEQSSEGHKSTHIETVYTINNTMYFYDYWAINSFIDDIGSVQTFIDDYLE